MFGSLLQKLVIGAATSAIDNFVRDKVSPIPGSVVYCDLAGGYAEHSGIYIGDGLIAHLDGDGRIESTNARKFLGRLGGLNPALSIYVSCRDGKAVGSALVASRAKEAIGSTRFYNLLLNNCHQFTAGCLSGKYENPSNFMYFLKHDAETLLRCNEWRVWDR